MQLAALLASHRLLASRRLLAAAGASSSKTLCTPFFHTAPSLLSSSTPTPPKQPATQPDVATASKAAEPELVATPEAVAAPEPVAAASAVAPQDVAAPKETAAPPAAPAGPAVPSPSSPSLWSSVRALPSSPAPALTLGLAGLIPFMAAPIYMYNADVFLPPIATAQLAYGASILSFLGGVRWGLLVRGGPDMPPSWSQYSWSVTPSLLAWTALLLPSQPAAFTLCTSGLLAALVLDLKQQGYPAWFRGLRFLLSLGAMLSLVSCLVLSFTLRGQQSDSLT